MIYMSSAVYRDNLRRMIQIISQIIKQAVVEIQLKSLKKVTSNNMIKLNVSVKELSS